MKADAITCGMEHNGKDMADDKSKTRPQDASRINVHERYELEYWSKHFGVTPERLASTAAS